MVCFNHFVKTIRTISRISEGELPLVARAVFAANARASEFLKCSRAWSQKLPCSAEEVTEVQWGQAACHCSFLGGDWGNSSTQVSRLPIKSFFYFRSLRNTLTGGISSPTASLPAAPGTELVEMQVSVWVGHILLHVAAISWWTFSMRQLTTSLRWATGYVPYTWHWFGP